jgi:Lrp/AsnC family leucine-responsive transcriptional regulator
VRRLKETGVIRRIAARVDSGAAGFPLQVYVEVTLEAHDDVAHRRFQDAVRAMPEVISADWVTGETDAMLLVVAREVAQLQRVLVRLSTRGGAARAMTLLRLEELKPASPLPLGPST